MIPTGPAVVTSTVVVSGAGPFLWDLDLTTNLTHTFAADLDVTPAQLALAWLLHRSPVVVPIPGSRTPDHIRENAAAALVALDDATRARIDAALAAFVPAGTVS